LVARELGARVLVRDGDQPAHVRDAVIDALSAREKSGFVVLEKPPPSTGR
jgi:hypothetical protein